MLILFSPFLNIFFINRIGHFLCEFVTGKCVILRDVHALNNSTKIIQNLSLSSVSLDILTKQNPITPQIYTYPVNCTFHLFATSVCV